MNLVRAKEILAEVAPDLAADDSFPHVAYLFMVHDPAKDGSPRVNTDLRLFDDEADFRNHLAQVVRMARG